MWKRWEWQAMLARKRVMKEHEGMRLKCNGNIGELLKLPDCLCVSVPDKESLMLYGEDGPVLGFRKFNLELMKSTCQVMKGCKPWKAKQIAEVLHLKRYPCPFLSCTSLRTRTALSDA